MPRRVVPLVDTQIEAARYSADGKGNKLADGGGLYLQLLPSGSKSWRLKYTKPNGKEDVWTMGLYPALSLSQARGERERVAALLVRGVDPKADALDKQIQQRRAEASTFEAVARDWHQSMVEEGRWCADYAPKVWSRIERHLLPQLGHVPVSSLETYHLAAVVRAIKKAGSVEQAGRMRQTIAAIMGHATEQGLIQNNPARDLKVPSSTRKTVHHAALPLSRLPELLGRIDGYQGRGDLARLATTLTLLVFIRSSELRFARWAEFDLKQATWTIPGEREAVEGVRYSHRGSKMRTPHIVPLSRQAVAVLLELYAITGHRDQLFPNARNDKGFLSENTVNKTLRKLGYDTKTEVCGHGFRTMARGALAESKLWQDDAVERQMSHKERNKVKLAYIHAAEFIQERRLMMQWWADYLDANQQAHVSPYDHAHAASAKPNVVRLVRK